MNNKKSTEYLQEKITLCSSDREFLNDVLSLSKEKQALLKGIVIGLQMQESMIKTAEA